MKYRHFSIEEREKTQEMLSRKRRIREREKQLDFRDEFLDKFVKVFDGITIHPVKGIILTPKKRRQIASLMRIERKILKSQTKKPRK